MSIKKEFSFYSHGCNSQTILTALSEISFDCSRGACTIIERVRIGSKSGGIAIRRFPGWLAN